jgi:GTP-dependent phosphoenolpyruvate carboxykinase
MKYITGAFPSACGKTNHWDSGLSDLERWTLRHGLFLSSKRRG